MESKPDLEELEQKIEQLKKEIGKKESDLNDIQKLAMIGNWEWNLKTQVLSWSDEVFNIFGWIQTPSILLLIPLKPLFIRTT